jgi:hypothetical protein
MSAKEFQSTRMSGHLGQTKPAIYGKGSQMCVHAAGCKIFIPIIKSNMNILYLSHGSLYFCDSFFYMHFEAKHAPFIKLTALIGTFYVKRLL